MKQLLHKIDRALSTTGLSNHFNGNIFSSYVIGSWKPDPGIFLHAAQKMGFKPHECAVVEDSHVGIAAAKSAGMLSVLYDPDGIHESIESARKIRHMRQLKSAII
ncbi:hypothetical protein CHH28_10720 [Bacterioplanes sanyensis]|uniref:Haloacid dehalogenase n=1 Tax=Bacterioplanes sanyensis TaxID=1249553 RepID=A0A222FLM2_9GAMM|nr:HAD-IA family hydrolase [Bacterioplanes sanyensis]ASP39123.1 hypothetical protein CHH28_10720 [Bacterioplanes sanyensis]